MKIIRAYIEETDQGPNVVTPARDIIRQIEIEKTPERRAEFAKAALTLDDLCIEAHLALAAATDSPNMKSVHLGNAVGAGTALWRPFLIESVEPVLWWKHAATRPYLNAVFQLGVVSAEIGETELARKCFEGLLQMHPQDAFGARAELEKLQPPHPSI